MPQFDAPPEQRASTQPFDPLVLDRTIIAIPLLKAMQEELNLIDTVLKWRREIAERYNTAVKLNTDYPGGPDEAYKEVLRIASLAVDEFSAVLRKRIERISNNPAADTQELDRVKQRLELAEALDRNRIFDQWEKINNESYTFALIDAGIVNRMITKHDMLRSGEDPQTSPIAWILPHRFEVVIDLNLEHPNGREQARRWVLENLETAKGNAKVSDLGQGIYLQKSRSSPQYLFGCLEARAIRELVKLDIEHALQIGVERKTSVNSDATKYRAIYHIWPDFQISACIYKSIATVKADAALNSFSARGAGITWAVMDSGIDVKHRHFVVHKNIDPLSTWHRDFTGDNEAPFDDDNGHGTHVAGIIAGEWPVGTSAGDGELPTAVSRYLKQDDQDIEYQQTRLEKGIRGMAPECKLVSLKVLDENGKGSVSNLIAAIAHVQEINGYGRRLLIHGVNLSLGYNFEPEWFACGQSPLCMEVDRLVKSGVVVVVAAGNSGYGTLKSSAGATAAGMALTINDPGNADLAITVGSTHRDSPHVYGVSYFSSKGPTGDGRIKPDLVAPGEKIVSCATGNLKKKGAKDIPCDYVETSGTSMAAPHVSGVIAGFLSVRNEFLGHPEKLKEIFVSTATDLKRDRYFQGAGLVDLMRAIQSV